MQPESRAQPTRLCLGNPNRYPIFGTAIRMGKKLILPEFLPASTQWPKRRTGSGNEISIVSSNSFSSIMINMFSAVKSIFLDRSNLFIYNTRYIIWQKILGKNFVTSLIPTNHMMKTGTSIPLIIQYHVGKIINVRDWVLGIEVNKWNIGKVFMYLHNIVKPIIDAHLGKLFPIEYRHETRHGLLIQSS
jgi:hypothetical protein